MAGELARRAEQLRTAEVIAALSLATDLGMGFPLEHGLHSTIVAIRLARQLGVDVAVEGQAYYGCLLGYVGCTADAEVAAGLFGEGVLLKHFTPVIFGSPRSTARSRRWAISPTCSRRTAHVWQKTTPLTLDERERIRLHPYYTERVLGRSPFLAALAPIATVHHERLDGSGYHRGAAAAVLAPPARLLAAADAYQSMTSPRPHRPALPPRDAASALRAEAGAGRLDARSVSDVLAAVGQVAGPVPRPAGLTDREAQVIGLVAHGLPTKRIAHVLGISAKTADRHIQNAYGKIGISSRAAAALFAMEHGLATWGELPIVREDRRS